MKIIRVPLAADMPLAVLAEQLRLQGFVVRSVSADRLRVDAPRSPRATVFDAAWWVHGARMVITRSEAGVTMTPQPAVARLALGSLLPGVTVASIFAHSPIRALTIGLGVSLAAFALSYASARRQRPVMLQLSDAEAPPTEERP